jgi:O-antigen/teichoic acid export membrane protein
MIQLLKRYWGDRFWRNNAIFLGGSLFVAFLNYLYYPILGRLMDVASFGEVQALLSIFNLGGVLMAAFQIVVINISANNKKTGAVVIQQFERLALIFMTVAVGVLVVFSAQLQRFFDFGSSAPFIIVGISLIVGVTLSFRRSYVQGKADFTAVSLVGIVQALGKLLFSGVLVYVGLSTFGAVAGILISQGIALVYIVKKARSAGYIAGTKSQLLPNLSLLRPELKYLLSVMTVFFVVTFLYTGDVLVVKRYFDPDTAGLYAGVSAIAKIIFFATASFAGVLLASSGQKFSPAHNYQILRKSLIMVLAIGSVTLLVFSVLPELIISVMIGNRYDQYAYLLPALSLVILSVSVINLYFYYFLALRRYVVVPIAIAGGSTAVFLTIIRHNSLEIVIQNFLVGSILILSLIASVRVYSWLRGRQVTP